MGSISSALHSPLPLSQASMQGGRTIHRIASSSRCLLPRTTQVLHAPAPCNTFTAPTRCYFTPTEDSTSRVDSTSTELSAPNASSPRLTLSEKLIRLGQTQKTTHPPPKMGRVKKIPVQPLSLEGYKPAEALREGMLKLFPKKHPRKLTKEVSFTSAFAARGAEGEVTDDYKESSQARPLRWLEQLFPGSVKRVKLPKGRRSRKLITSRKSVLRETTGGESADRTKLFERALRAISGTNEWPGEPWADAVQRDASRTPPPHITPADQLAEGVIGTDTGLLVDVAPKSEHQPVATLCHELDRVLFNPGVHWLRDPRSRVYNFTPWLEEIPKVNDFAFERLSGFVKSSRDEDLRALAIQEDRKFAGSTSSMSGMLSHIYFLLSEHKDVETESLSQHFVHESSSFSWGQRAPTAVVLNYKDGHYAIDSYVSESDDSEKNVLTWLGTLLENFLTKPPKEFKTFLKEESVPIKPDEAPLREAYRYAKSEKFVMRSQLDCHDPRLPGTGVFDLKTRACVSIRQDILNYEENAGYMIKTQHGLLESFEREYYDLIRSAFLKYSFQVRIGNMDGVMVAYHNTERIFGFQYISLDEMDERLYGPVPGIGDKIFKKCIGILETILEEASNLFPEQSVLCYFETPTAGNRETVMEVFVEPEAWDEGMGPKPVEQLSVSVKHLLDGEEVRSRVALRSVEQEWTVKYEINKASLPLEVTRSSVDLLIKRKAFNRFLPSHIHPDNAQEYWESLSFGSRSSVEPAKEEDPHKVPKEDDSPAEETENLRAAENAEEGDVNEEGKRAGRQRESRALFSSPSAAVQRYREMSRQGRLEYDRMKQAEKDMPKILLGHGVYTGEEGLGSEGSSVTDTDTEQTPAQS